MAFNKETFMKEVTIYCDTREQENDHIISKLDMFNVKHEDKKLDYGDYSFAIEGRDFSLSCAIERKRNIDEIYGNLTKDRSRIEKEFSSATCLCNQFVLLIENCESWDYLKNFQLQEWEMKKFKRQIQDIGGHVYSSLISWQCGNRYKFRTLFILNNSNSAAKILEEFYYYWRNYKMLTQSRGR